MTYEELATRVAGMMRRSTLPGATLETAEAVERIWEAERASMRGGWGHFLGRMIETIMISAYYEGVRDGQRTRQ